MTVFILGISKALCYDNGASDKNDESRISISKTLLGVSNLPNLSTSL
jgi:hypothetical protein